MLCSKCGADNPETAKFCIERASAFARRCLSCGTENPPHAKFCAQCATRVGDHTCAASPTTSVVPSRANLEVKVPLTESKTDDQLEGERKTVTALFADIKGSKHSGPRLVQCDHFVITKASLSIHEVAPNAWTLGLDSR